MPRQKVSREGVVLIKSFEGFRPQAVKRADGSWVIGYGHTRSAREGARVSEADAELLLQYDLLPIVAELNGLGASLNQHQFDALASFAFSVGADRFASSEVPRRIRDGAVGEVADVLLESPEPPEAAPRRRAAERALFVADPAAPVALADLLSAPLPPPAVPQTQIDPSETRAAAVASLLGEHGDDEALIEAIDNDLRADTSALDEPAPLHNAASDGGSHSEAIEADQEIAETPAEENASGAPGLATPGNLASIAETVTSAIQPVAEPEPPTAGDEAPASIEPEAPADGSAYESGDTAPRGPIAGFNRFSAYATPVVGPLPEPSLAAGALATPQIGPLVLTAPDILPESDGRPVWPDDQRVREDAAQERLFDEGAELQTFGPVMRHEVEERPARQGWGDTGPFVIMGAVGLVSFGAALAGFRRASEQLSGSGDMTLIAWILAVIGVICIGVSAYNLYRRLGRSGRD